MNFLLLSLSLAVFTLSPFASADNLPAGQCQIFIKSLMSTPSSHGSQSLQVVVKTGWIGNGEIIQRVGFYGKTDLINLGNSPACHLNPENEGWKVSDAQPGRAVGESVFSFSIETGSVTNACGGYTKSTQGSFFVETNKNTYWLNPSMDSSQYFFFDQNAYQMIVGKGTPYVEVSTARGDMSYYNPMGCR